MDLKTQMSLDVIISLLGGVIGAVGAYIKLKSKIDILETNSINQEKEIVDLNNRKKEMNAALHKRIDDQKKEVSELQKEVSQGHNKLETAMAKMELRIIREFQSVIAQISNKKEKL